MSLPITTSVDGMQKILYYKTLRRLIDQSFSIIQKLQHCFLINPIDNKREKLLTRKDLFLLVSTIY